MISAFFKSLQTFLDERIAPISEKLDVDFQTLHNAYRELVELGALRLLIPAHLNGLGGDRSEWLKYNILMAQYSGALLFIQAQHQYSVSKLKQLMPGKPIEACLQTLARENKGIGICGAADKKILLGEPEGDGYRINGELYWVTGYQFFDEILTSFDYGDSNYYIKLPLDTIENNGGKIEVGDLITTAVFNSTNTIKVKIQNWFVSHADIIAQVTSDKNKPLIHPTAYNFAGASIALLALAKNGKYADNPQIEKRHRQLSERLEQYCEFLSMPTDNPCGRRAQGRQLAEECAMFTRSAWGAASIIASNPMNRICREIWQYTVAGYTEEQVEAYITTQQ